MKSNKALSASFRENNDKNVKYVPLFHNSTSTPETRSSCVRCFFIYFFPYPVPGNHGDVGGDRDPEDVEVVDMGWGVNTWRWMAFCTMCVGIVEGWGDSTQKNTFSLLNKNRRKNVKALRKHGGSPFSFSSGLFFVDYFSIQTSPECSSNVYWNVPRSLSMGPAEPQGSGPTPAHLPPAAPRWPPSGSWGWPRSWGRSLPPPPAHWTTHSFSVAGREKNNSVRIGLGTTNGSLLFWKIKFKRLGRNYQMNSLNG